MSDQQGTARHSAAWDRAPRTFGARLQLAVAIVAAATTWLTVAPAAHAATPAPAWTITSTSEPTNFAPGDSSGHDTYAVIATDSGGGPTDGSTPITITDQLPSGLTLDPAGASTQNAGGQIGQDNNGNTVTCSAGPPVSCTDAQNTAPLQPGQEITIVVPVDVASGALGTVTNSVSVTGGGATTASDSEPTTVSATPASYAVQSFDGGVYNADGSPDTQAGSRPWDDR
jgi:hypothetical protein